MRLLHPCYWFHKRNIHISTLGGSSVSLSCTELQSLLCSCFKASNLMCLLESKVYTVYSENVRIHVVIGYACVIHSLL